MPVLVNDTCYDKVVLVGGKLSLMNCLFHFVFLDFNPICKVDKLDNATKPLLSVIYTISILGAVSFVLKRMTVVPSDICSGGVTVLNAAVRIHVISD